MASYRNPKGSNRGSAQSDLHEALKRADRLLEQKRPEEVEQLLRGFLPRHTDNPELHQTLGRAHFQAGNIWSAAAHYHQTQRLRRTAELWAPLGFLFANLGLHALALDAFRQALKNDPDGTVIREFRERAESYEERIRVIGRVLDLTPEKTERGLRFFEEAQIALHDGSYTRCISLNRRAIQILGDFTPCYNNLSLALFFSGSPEEAIRAGWQVLHSDPENVQALANMIRFLAWTGRETEARGFWSTLSGLEPFDHSQRMKFVEAAAMMEDDEAVYGLLTARITSDEVDRGSRLREELYLAVAEANLGYAYAKERLESLREQIPFARTLLKALDSGLPGPGCADRFPYFHATELLPESQLEAFFELLGGRSQMSEARLRRQIERFVTRFPQIVLFAEKVILEEGDPHGGIAILEILGTPEAHDALRRFALGQAGDDEDRMQAIAALQRSGRLGQSEVVRVWLGGEWRETILQAYAITDGEEPGYSPEVNALLVSATEAGRDGREEEAETLYDRVMRLDPRVKEALNNLAVIYARRGEEERARELLQRALEVDPLYIFPRCSLAGYLLAEDKSDEAEEMIAPLLAITSLRALEMAFLCLTRARIHTHRGQHDAARNLLKMALEVLPEYEPAARMLENLDMSEDLQAGIERWTRQRAQRDRAKRRDLQAQIATTDPSLEESLSLYSKDALGAMARNAIQGGGWSMLRKAELRRRIVDELRDPEVLGRILAALEEPEKAALSRVLDSGGRMRWDAFDGAYGNDLEEPAAWHFHQPETIMGRLRSRGLVVEATVEGELFVVVPVELREPLHRALFGH